MMFKFSRIGRNWRIIIAMTLLAVGLSIFRLLGYCTTAEAINMLLIATLVLVTAVYAGETTNISKSSEKSSNAMEAQAEATREMAEEMRQERFASFQPIVVMGRSLASVEPPNVNIVVEQTTIKHRTYLYNVGPGPALNLRFYLKEPNRKNPSGTFSGKELRALGPGEVYELDLKNVFGQMRWASHDLIVEYEDIFAGKWRSGLELNYTQGQEELTVVNLFYEKLD